MIGWLSKEQVEEVLKNNQFGHIGCNDGFNTYVYPINYVYDGKFIICHSQPGAKTGVMRENKRVCFQVDEIKDYWHWKSVMVLGEYHELEDERERYNAMKEFLARMMQLKVNKPGSHTGFTEEEASGHLSTTRKPIIFRISLEESSGRYEADSV